jgi:hypothetical protein
VNTAFELDWRTIPERRVKAEVVVESHMALVGASQLLIALKGLSVVHIRLIELFSQRVRQEFRSAVAMEDRARLCLAGAQRRSAPGR